VAAQDVGRVSRVDDAQDGLDVEPCIERVPEPMRQE